MMPFIEANFSGARNMENGIPNLPFGLNTPTNTSSSTTVSMPSKNNNVMKHAENQSALEDVLNSSLASVLTLSNNDDIGVLENEINYCNLDLKDKIKSKRRPIIQGIQSDSKEIQSKFGVINKPHFLFFHRNRKVYKLK